MKKIVKILLKYPVKLINYIYVYFYYKLGKKGKYNINDMLTEKRQSVLIVAPHVDDETIGLGGSMIEHSNRNDDITLLYITDGGASNIELSKSETVELRKKEAYKIKEKLNIKEIIFLDKKDGKVLLDDVIINDLYKIVNESNPDIIYTPFLIDGHNDHVETTKSLINAIENWDKDFENIFMYEINCPINTELINSVCVLNKEVYYEKISLLDIFKSQKVMGFNSFTLLNRMKRHIVDSGYASEVFVKSNINDLKTISVKLNSLDFKHYYFKQLSSEYNLLISFLKSNKLKKKYSLEVKKIFLEKEEKISFPY